MVQWINVFQNNSVINLTRLPLLCRNSRAVALVKPGLTAGWLADRQNACKIQNFKIHFRSNFYTFSAFNKATTNRNAFKLVFSAKICFKVIVGGVKIGEAIVFLIDPYY